MRVGLTGGIASGKSAVSRLFAARGVPIIDSDDIGARAARARQPAARCGVRALRRRSGASGRQPRSARCCARGCSRTARHAAPARDAAASGHPAERARQLAAQRRGPYQIPSCRCWWKPGWLRASTACWSWIARRRCSSRGCARATAVDARAGPGDARAQAARAARLAAADDVIAQRRQLEALAPQVARSACAVPGPARRHRGPPDGSAGSQAFTPARGPQAQ